MSKTALRYASHIGYRPPFEPLFRASVGSDDAVEHVRFAAEHGFAGLLYAAARKDSAQEQQRVGDALRRYGLQAGCLLYTTFDKLRHTAWGSDEDEARRWIDGEIAAAIEVARRTGARQLAVLGGADTALALAQQQAAMAGHLHRAADTAARAGLTLCVETLNAASVPGMLLHHIGDALAVVRAANHPAVRLIFDTAHAQAMDGDVLPWLERAWPHVEVVQLADHPGRLEPGSGQVDFAGLLRLLVQRGYAGMVELEHGWAQPGLQAETRGLAHLLALDAQAAGIDRQAQGS
jgi:hydroxypyruvate isomerase